MLGSIRGRLTLWLALLIALCLGALALFLSVAVARVLTENLDHTLRVQAQQVAVSYDFGGPEAASAAAAQHVDIGALDQFATGGIFVEILDPRGRVRTRSTNLGTAVLPLPVPATVLRRGPSRATAEVAGGAMRLYSSPSVQDGRLQGVVLVAASLRPVQETTRTLVLLLLLGGALSIGLAVVGSGLLVRRGLRPLDEMAAVAEGINARLLDQRLGLRQPREIARLASTFDAMLDRLHEAFAAQGRFVADASHELRTPLAIVHGRAEVLLLDPGLVRETREGVDMIRDEAARMGRLVANLLLLARGEGGRGIDRQPVDLDALRLVVLGQAQTLDHGVIVTAGRHDPAVVLGDADLLKQVLLNLLDNALAHTAAGGRVELSLTVLDGMARVAIRDDGPGIAPADLERIFERFFRVDQARTRRDGGAGLGLAIARWIAEAHDGRIEVRSALGQGSAFTLVLPIL